MASVFSASLLHWYIMSTYHSVLVYGYITCACLTVCHVRIRTFQTAYKCNIKFRDDFLLCCALVIFIRDGYFVYAWHQKLFHISYSFHITFSKKKT